MRRGLNAQGADPVLPRLVGRAFAERACFARNGERVRHGRWVRATCAPNPGFIAPTVSQQAALAVSGANRRDVHSPTHSPGAFPACRTRRNRSPRAKYCDRERLNAAVSKTVSGEIPPTRVRIPPPPFCDVARHRRQMSQDIVDTSRLVERLVVAAGIEHQLAEDLALDAEHAHVAMRG